MRGVVGMCIPFLLFGCTTATPEGSPSATTRVANALRCARALAADAAAVQQSPALRALGDKPSAADVSVALTAVDTSSLTDESFDACLPVLEQAGRNIDQLKAERAAAKSLKGPTK